MHNNELEMNELYKKRIKFLVTNSQTKKNTWTSQEKWRKSAEKKWIEKLIIWCKCNKKLEVKKSSKFKCFKWWRQFFDEKVITYNNSD